MARQPETELQLDVFIRGLRVQARCLYALMVREMMMRYGRDNLGFLWVFIEPMLLCVGVMIIWTFIHAPYEHGVTVIELVLTGYMPLTLWRHFISAGVLPFKRSVALLYHRHVTLLDVFFLRMFLVFAGSTSAFIIVTSSLILAGLIAPPHDIGLVIAGWISMAVLSSGIALVIAILTESSEVSERFVPVYQYLSLPISGCFFMVDWLPTFAQNLSWYNPSVHCYEMVRAGFFGESVQTHFAAWYPISFGVALFAGGIGLVNGLRDHIHD